MARLRIFNPDGSEAELSGNGAREAVLYLRRRGWATSDTFSIQTAAGEIRPTITSATTARLDMGRVRLRSADYPSGPDDGAGIAHRRRTRMARSSTSRSATRSARSASATWPSSRRWTCPRSVRASSTTSCFPNRTNVSWYTVA